MPNENKTDIAVIYGRQSKDKKTSIEQQMTVGRSVIKENGWELGGTYQDGSSASRFATKGRDDWARLLKDLQAGEFGVLILWEPSRGDRDLESWVAFLADCRARGVRIYVKTAERLYDCRLARDWKTLVEDGLDSAYESEKTSIRSKRNTDAMAAAGRPHGMVAYGYRRERTYDDYGRLIDTRDVIDPEQAELIRETSRRLLAGESLRSIVGNLNTRGLTSPKGIPWSSTTLRQVMLRERNGGLRRHRGKVLGKAAWEPIYDEGTHARVVALLTDPSRTSGLSSKGATRKHLLSGIARCGLCDGLMRAISGTVYRGKTIVPKYQCKDCFKVARRKDLVDDIVTAVVIERLQRPDAVRALAVGRPERAVELQEMIAGAKARLDLAADGFADGAVNGEQLRRIGAKLTPQIGEWEAELASCAPHEGILDLTGPGAAERWHGASLDVQQVVLGLLMRVTVLPTGPGIRFDPDDVVVTDGGRVIVFSKSIQIEWKESGHE